MTGGVRAGTIQSCRDQYAEQNVRRQTVLLGQANRNVNSFTALESLFDISGNSGIPKALNNLLQSFSAWGQSPNDTVARQTVIERATDLATSFQQAASGVEGVVQDTNQQLQQTVDQVNHRVGQLQGYNEPILGGDRNDSGAIGSSISALQQASDHLNSMEAFYGTVQNRIQDATSFASQYDIQLQTEIRQKQDADVTAAAGPR